MNGQYMDASTWCKPQVIFNNAMKSRRDIKMTPLRQSILSDESYWIQEIGDMCSAAQSASYQEFPNSIRIFYFLKLYEN